MLAEFWTVYLQFILGAKILIWLHPSFVCEYPYPEWVSILRAFLPGAIGLCSWRLRFNFAILKNHTHIHTWHYTQAQVFLQYHLS